HAGSGRRAAFNAGLAVIAGRTVGALSRRLHMGGGTSIVGVVAQRVYPGIVAHLATQLEYGCVLVTGTNGKTTTSSFITAILRDGGLRVWRNREGSNLERGVASSLVIRALPNGQLRRSGRAISVLEIDEAALPHLVQQLPARVVVFTNLFRDQLDRYGEVDSVATFWRNAISQLPQTTTLVLNADDPGVAFLGESFAGKKVYYGIDDLALNQLTDAETARYQVMDTRTCPRCGGEFVYDARFYSHMGHYHCPQCGLRRPEPDIRAVQVQHDTFDRQRVQVMAGTSQQEVVIPLPGLYNIYNALAAITAARSLDVEWEPVISGIEQAKPAFGRGERVQVEGRTLRLLLAKNPTGFNEVLRTLFSQGAARHMLFVLNDNIADGRDISWIWDVDFERAVGLTPTLVVAGTRAFDLGLRLKYAGMAEEAMTIIPPQPLPVARETTRSQGAMARIQNIGAQFQHVGARFISPSASSAVPSGSSAPPVSPTPSAPPTAASVAVTSAPARVYGLKKALAVALAQTPVGETLFIVPTYTGLLEVHHELEQRGLTPHYWEGDEA
ncbi:MAG TPA: MurT ligase domain-containing protein, partial [Ktedonobacteraceae bacterium]|nr:MurT ligase domain-containing protein [Ktedonobacteraceae bacterium]